MSVWPPTCKVSPPLDHRTVRSQHNRTGAGSRVVRALSGNLASQNATGTSAEAGADLYLQERTNFAIDAAKFAAQFLSVAAVPECIGLGACELK